MTGLCERCRVNEPAPNDGWCPECILEVELSMAEDEERGRTFQPLGLNGHYTIADIEMRVAEYEDEYGLPSDALLELHKQEAAPIDLPAFDRHVWLSLYREMLEHRTS